MKKKILHNKLSLQKVTIARLSSNTIRGGAQQTFQPSCLVCPVLTVNDSCIPFCLETFHDTCGNCVPKSVVACPEL